MGHQNAETLRRAHRLHDELTQRFGSLSRVELWPRRREVIGAAAMAATTTPEAAIWFERLAVASRPTAFKQAFDSLLTALTAQR